MKKASGFKMKNPSVAKLAKTAGSPMKQSKVSYKQAFDNMLEDPTGGTRSDKFGNIYTNDAKGLANFTKAAKAYNAKKSAPKAENKPVVNDKPKVDNKPTPTPKPKTKVGKFLSRVVGTGAKRKANEANKKKRQNRSVTGRLKAKASKFGRMGT